MYLLNLHHFLYSASLGALYPFYILFIKYHLQASSSAIITILCISSIFRALFPPIILVFEDRWRSNCKHVLLSSLVLSVLCHGCLLTLPWIKSNAAGLVLTGIGVAGNEMAASIVKFFSRSSKSSMQSKLSSVGYGLIPTVLVIFDPPWMPSLLLSPTTALFLLFLDICVMFCISDQQFYDRSHVEMSTLKRVSPVCYEKDLVAPSDEPKLFEHISSLIKGYPIILHFMFLFFLVGAMSAFQFNFFPWLLHDLYHEISVSQVIFAIFVNVLSEYLLGRMPLVELFALHDKLYRHTGATKSLYLVLALYGIIFISYHFMLQNSADQLFLIQTLIGFINGLTDVAVHRVCTEYSLKDFTASLIYQDEPHDKLRTFFIFMVMIDFVSSGLGAAAGNILAGDIIHWRGVRSLWLFAAMLAFACLAVNIIFEIINCSFRACMRRLRRPSIEDNHSTNKSSPISDGSRY